MNKGDKKVISDVAEYGFHIINVLEDEEGPPHTFSIGLFHSFKHPEVIVIGLNTDLMKDMVGWIGEDVKKGLRFETGKAYAGLLECFDCTFRAVAKKRYPEYLGYAMWFYKGMDFPVVQCVWPTTSGYFPWDEGFPGDLIEWQPLLDH
ncbi:MAG: DUF4262 domain-containing protein [Blastocatellia bacterium]|nr:DUF4262 domain-containing protein [Blastocatellia bacterium]